MVVVRRELKGQGLDFFSKKKKGKVTTPPDERGIDAIGR